MNGASPAPAAPAMHPNQNGPNMRTSSRLLLLGTLGVLSVAGSDAFAADPSQWTCETCPFEKGLGGSVDVGVGSVSRDAAKFGDFTGLERNGPFFIGGGTARYRGEDGLFGSVAASDLGLDTRSLSAQIGREGSYALRFGYAEIPHRPSDSVSTPFLGIGGSVLSLPAGFPAATTAAMPLQDTLQTVGLGFKRSRFDLRAAWLAGDPWTLRMSFRRDVRDGTQRTAGSFFATTSQLVAPVDQVTDQLELSTSYAGRGSQATLAYQASVFRNGPDSLTWANPFASGVLGSASGQLALAPDNQFHQVLASAGYAISPTVRTSVELAIGRMTQDAPYVAATVNPGLAVSQLPAPSLRGRANTLDASVRLSAAPTERWRLNASVSRNERDNETPAGAYPAVSTDLFLGPVPRVNQPYSFTQDRLKLGGDFRGPDRLRIAFAAEHDTRTRSLQETARTREATLWGRISAPLGESVSVALKLARAERSNSEYRALAWIDPAENPLLRKYNQAERRRDTVGLRADIALGEGVGVGLSVDFANDDYKRSTVGLLDGRSVNLGGDVSVAVSDKTQLHLFAQGERIRSRQAGSQLVAQPDWSGRSKDGFEVLGAGVTHLALDGKLDLGADLSFARSRSDMGVDTGASSPAFPTATTLRDTVKLRATYRLMDNLSLSGSYWYERYDAQDWRLDGVLPATVANLLAFGEQPPRYRVHVLGLALRYRFQ